MRPHRQTIAIGRIGHLRVIGACGAGLKQRHRLPVASNGGQGAGVQRGRCCLTGLKAQAHRGCKLQAHTERAACLRGLQLRGRSRVGSAVQRLCDRRPRVGAAHVSGGDGVDRGWGGGAGGTRERAGERAGVGIRISRRSRITKPTGIPRRIGRRLGLSLGQRIRRRLAAIPHQRQGNGRLKIIRRSRCGGAARDGGGAGGTHGGLSPAGRRLRVLALMASDLVMVELGLNLEWVAACAISLV